MLLDNPDNPDNDDVPLGTPPLFLSLDRRCCINPAPLPPLNWGGALGTGNPALDRIAWPTSPPYLSATPSA